MPTKSKKTVQPIPDGYRAVTPYLLVRDIEKTIDFTKKAFGARLRESVKGPEGKPIHATIVVDDSAIMLAQSNEQHPAIPSMLYIYVPDVDAVYEKAIKAGGIKIMEPKDQLYGDRSGGVRDSSGNQWWIGTHIEDVSDAEIAKRYAAQTAKQQQAAGSSQG